MVLKKILFVMLFTSLMSFAQNSIPQKEYKPKTLLRLGVGVAVGLPGLVPMGESLPVNVAQYFLCTAGGLIAFSAATQILADLHASIFGDRSVQESVKSPKYDAFLENVSSDGSFLTGAFLSLVGFGIGLYTLDTSNPDSQVSLTTTACTLFSMALMMNAFAKEGARHYEDPLRKKYKEYVKKVFKV